MNYKLFIIGLMASSTLLAECSYQGQTSKVSWKAFKTYEKIGVAGVFDRIDSQPKHASSIEELLTGSSVIIQTKSLNSGNAGRDATLSQSFFNTQNVDTITAKIQSAKASKAYVEITMNKTTHIIPMNYTLNNDLIVAKGVIDLSDFNMIPSLHAISKACFDLHGGKTWQDVEIAFEMPLKQSCK
ncbi:MAG: YceI family protein [Sulfuricurvum sp.]